MTDADAPQLDLSYLLRESQRRLLDDLIVPLLRDVMQHNYGFLSGASQFQPDGWLPGRQAWVLPDSDTSRGDIGRVSIVFAADQLGWQDGSQVSYGTSRVVSDTARVKPEATYLVDNTAGVSDLAGELDETVTYLHSRTVTTAQQWHLDIGSSQKFTIGGKAPGAGFELSVNEAFGWKQDTSQAVADSTSVTRAQKLSYSVPRGKAQLAELKSPTIVTSQPLTLSAWWTMPFTVDVHGMWLQAAWAVVKGPRTTVSGDGYGRAVTRFTGWDDFDAFLRATNTEFPAHSDPWNPRTQFDPATGALPKSSHTLLAMTGLVAATEQHATEWTFRDVTGTDPATLDIPDGHTIAA